MFCYVSLLGTFLSMVVVWLIAVTAPLGTRWLSVRLLGPKLSLEIDPEYVPASAENGENGKFYVRVKITNVKRRIARACRGHLVAFDEWNAASKAFESVFSDSVPLICSYYPLAETFDVPQNAHFCVDVVLYEQEHRGPVLQIWNKENGTLKPDKLKPYLKKYGTYRFSVLVSADDIPPGRKEFKVTCDEKTWPPRVEDTTSSNSS